MNKVIPVCPKCRTHLIEYQGKWHCITCEKTLEQILG